MPETKNMAQPGAKIGPNKTSMKMIGGGVRKAPDMPSKNGSRGPMKGTGPNFTK